MADQYRVRMIQAYKQIIKPSLFLSSFFVVRPGNIFDGKKVKVDIRRIGEDVAKDVAPGTGPNLNDHKGWTNKEFTPPTYDEASPFDAESLNKRLFGMDEYASTDVGYQAALVTMIMEHWQINQEKIERAMELQASEILQNGTLTFENTDSIDFKVKASHLATAGTAWNAVGADPLGDLESLMDVVRQDGKMNIRKAIFGSDAIDALLSNATVLERLDNRKMNIGEITPQEKENEAKYHGKLSIGSYTIELWSYNGRYDDPDTGVHTKFIDDANVILLPDNPRFDKLFAGVPRLKDTDPQFRNILPSRVSIPEAIDFSPYIHVGDRGKTMEAGIESRPLLVPTAVDTFARLATGV